MEKFNNKLLEKLRKAETGINNHLFLICAGVTVIIMLMVVVEFFSRGAFSFGNMSLFYLGVLIIYAIHKELLRWLGEKKSERQGEYFIYSWIALTTILFLINFFSKNFYSFTFAGHPSNILSEVSVLSLEVLAIFIFTRALKMLKLFLNDEIRNQ